jgi:hypothetical protein
VLATSLPKAALFLSLRRPSLSSGSFSRVPFVVKMAPPPPALAELSSKLVPRTSSVQFWESTHAL